MAKKKKIEAKIAEVRKFKILTPAVYDRFGKLCYSGDIVDEDRLIKATISELIYSKHIELWQEETFSKEQ